VTENHILNCRKRENIKSTGKENLKYEKGYEKTSHLKTLKILKTDDMD